MTAPRVCVLGGGTAGFLAAAHLSRHFPGIELTHCFDSRIPTIGVGEGTTPPFRRWMEETLGLGFETLERRCAATPKEGIRFENWGAENAVYTHLFGGAEGEAWHISAARITALLDEFIDARRLDRHVERVTSDGRQAAIRFEGGAEEVFDLVLDARGFPARDDPDLVRVAGIPTNAALIRRGPPVAFRSATRAVARPHGWIFVIPLTVQTSYGYVHDADGVDAAELEADLDAFLAEEGVTPDPGGRRLRFPNYVRRRIFDGAHFRIGNAASFLEPLEATAIAVALHQLQLVSGWLFLLSTGADPARSPAAAATVDARARAFTAEAGRFVAWHYARGARFDTPFWRKARSGWGAALAADAPNRAAFERFVARGARFPAALARAEDRAMLAGIAGVPAEDETYGGFLAESFAKVGHGMGFYAA